MNLTQILAWTPTFDPLLAPRADATPLVPQGVAAVLKAGQIHTYEVPPDLRDEVLTLSICSYTGNSSTIYLKINSTSYATTSGLMSFDSLDSVKNNGTISVIPPTHVTPDSQWNYQLGVGNSGSYSVSGDDIFLVDTDFANALLVSSPLEDVRRILLDTYSSTTDDDILEFISSANFTTSNFTLGIVPHVSSMDELSQSYCAIQENALLNENNADISTTTRGTASLLKSQWLVKGLNKSSDYYAYMGIRSMEKGSLGGTIFSPANFSTKTSTSCQIVYNMSFCSGMAFAVPGNASSYTPLQLTQYYDELAQSRYRNFSNSLQQINCNLSMDRQFSPIRNCGDCDVAYKNWLCTTTIPRCADTSNNASYLVTRHPGQSRNPLIDQVIQPGTYKEILPCKELCYALARNCPSAFGFGCPSGRMMELTYGDYSEDGDVTCSYPGAVYNENAAVWLGPSLLLVIVALTTALIL